MQWLKSRSCVQSLSRFQSNLRVISRALHSILSFPCMWLEARPAAGGRLWGGSSPLHSGGHLFRCLKLHFPLTSFTLWLMDVNHVSIPLNLWISASDLLRALYLNYASEQFNKNLQKCALELWYLLFEWEYNSDSNSGVVGRVIPCHLFYFWLTPQQRKYPVFYTLSHAACLGKCMLSVPMLLF